MLSFDQKGKGNGMERGVMESANSHLCAFLIFLHFPYLMSHPIISGLVNESGSVQGPVNFNKGLEVHNEWKE